MTILDMLIGMHTNNELITKALEIIKEDFTSSVNDNYELTSNEKGELMVKIPSLEKKDEFVYNSVAEYQYTLVMCMRMTEFRNSDKYNFILGKFMELHKDKLEVFFKDVNTVDTLKARIIRTKENIDYITYASLVIMILGAISLCIFKDMTQMVRAVLIIGMVLFSVISLTMQLTKEGQVKSVIDGYISVINTDWYRKELSKQYVFLCNFIG